MVKLKIQNTEGVESTVNVTAENPKIRTLLSAGQFYRDGDLIQLAATGKLNDEAAEASPALLEMSQETAIEIVTDRFKEGSDNLTSVVEPKKAAKDAEK